MKRHETATSVSGQTPVERGTGAAVHRAASEALAERNGGLPPNLHMASRQVLLKVIAKQRDEILALKARAEG